MHPDLLGMGQGNISCLSWVFEFLLHFWGCFIVRNDLERLCFYKLTEYWSLQGPYPTNLCWGRGPFILTASGAIPFPEFHTNFLSIPVLQGSITTPSPFSVFDSPTFQQWKCTSVFILLPCGPSSTIYESLLAHFFPMNFPKKNENIFLYRPL